MRIKLTTVISIILLLISIIIFIISLNDLISYYPEPRKLSFIGLILSTIYLICRIVHFIVWNWDDLDDITIDFGVITRHINKIFKS